MQWEYRVEPGNYLFSEHFAKDLTEGLARDGMQGWELVTVFPMSQIFPVGEDNEVRLCFIYKRPKYSAEIREDSA